MHHYSLVSGAQRLVVHGHILEALMRAARPIVDESSVRIVGAEAALQHQILAISCVDRRVVAVSCRHYY